MTGVDGTMAIPIGPDKTPPPAIRIGDVTLSGYQVAVLRELLWAECETNWKYDSDPVGREFNDECRRLYQLVKAIP